MSIDMDVLVPLVDTEVIRKLTSRLADCGMECEFHPQFVDEPHSVSGFVPIRMRVSNSPVRQYDGIEILTGFEIYIDEFDFGQYNESLEHGSSNGQETLDASVLVEILQRCRNRVTVVIHSNPTSVYRTGLYFAVILAEVTDGVLYDPQAGEFLLATDAISSFAKEVSDYEQSVPESDWKLVPFDGWIA